MKIEIDEKVYKGRYRVYEGMMSVKYLNSVILVPLDGIDEETLANMLLSELVQQDILRQPFIGD